MNSDSSEGLWLNICRFSPGLKVLSHYQPSWLRSDVGAGLSVAAVALPVGIAYADLVGVPAVYGIYSAIFPLLAYVLFGSSRQLMVGPDAPLCLLVASSLALLAGGDPARYLSFMVAMTLLTGVLLVIASFFRLGFIANFLSQPILTGYLLCHSKRCSSGQRLTSAQGCFSRESYTTSGAVIVIWNCLKSISSKLKLTRISHEHCVYLILTFNLTPPDLMRNAG